MKKKIHKIWGIGFVVVLAASLLLSAAPVSAGTLDWGTETIPSKTGHVLAPGFDVIDLAVSADGVMYSINLSDNFVWKSTNGGVTWSKLSKNFAAVGGLAFVGVSLDDSDVLAVTNTTHCWISVNGGSTWGSLGAVNDTTAVSQAGVITDLAVSAADGSVNYVGVSGNSTTGIGADVWWFNVGASAPRWHSTRVESGFDSTQDTGLAVAFSPNVASDKVMVTVTALIGTNTTYQMFSLNTETWNTPFGSGYPVLIQNNSTAIPQTNTADIALSPDFLGSDDSMRIGFLGLNVGVTDTLGGVYRLKDDTDKAIYDDLNIHSVTYDGTNLIAGATDVTKVYRCDNSLASSPDFSGASSLKRPGGESKVIVEWRGTDVVAGTSGTASAFSVSTDNGKSFNDISLVDVADTSTASLGTMVDVDVAPDGSVIFMLVRDANALSLWRNASSWQRVLTIIGADAKYLVRVAPDDPDAVYVASKNATAAKTIYYTQEGGDTKWFTRTAKYAIEDLAVESADVVYIAVNDSTTVSRSTNSGFTWDTAKDTEITGGNIYMIRSLGEDDVIVGSTEGYVAWTSDGNSSWDKINTKLHAAYNVQVTASGLADGDYIYCATDATGDRVERWEIGQSGTSWKNLTAPLGGCQARGIGLADGVLYVQTANTTSTNRGTTLRTLTPTTGEPAEGMWSIMREPDARFEATPQALKVSSGSVKLWSVSTNTSALYSFLDELTTVGPTLIGPRDGAEVGINPVSGVAYDIPFTWERPSKAKIYDLKIALDSGFLEGLGLASTTTSSTTDAEISEVIEGKYFMPDTTYYWRVRVNIAGAVRSAFSETRSFTIGSLPEALPPVIIEQPPAPVIQVPPAPSITITPPDIVLPPAPAPPPDIVIPPAPAPPAPITPAFIWAIIIIGAILVIAVVVLIVRTRRPV